MKLLIILKMWMASEVSWRDLWNRSSSLTEWVKTDESQELAALKDISGYILLQVEGK